MPDRADGTTVTSSRRGCKRSGLGIASDPQALSSAVRELENRVFAESSKGTHARKLQSWADVAKAIILTLATPRQPSGKQGKELVLNHATMPEAFDIHFRRVRRAVARGRGLPQQASALPFLRFAQLND